MLRKIHGILSVVTVAVPLVLAADTSSAPAGLSAAQYKEWGKRLVANMTEKELKEARDSSEYKQNYDSITSQLDKAPADKAVQTCRAALSNGQ